MLYLVTDDGQVCGKGENLVLLQGYFLIEGADYDEGELHNLYVESKELKVKPARPSEVSAWDSEKKKWVELDPVISPPELPPDYLKFRLGMLQDLRYDQIATTSSQRQVTRLEIAITQNPPELPVVAAMWNALIDKLTDKPKAVEVKAWNAIASTTNVPLKFGDDGKMILR